MYLAFLLFLYHDFFYFTFFFYLYSISSNLFFFWTTCCRLANKITMYFTKKNKCKVNLYNIATVQHNYLWMITSKNWLKRIVNITFFHILIFFFHFICLDFRTANSDVWPEQARHRNISFILIVARFFQVLVFASLWSLPAFSNMAFNSEMLELLEEFSSKENV